MLTCDIKIGSVINIKDHSSSLKMNGVIYFLPFKVLLKNIVQILMKYPRTGKNRRRYENAGMINTNY